MAFAAEGAKLALGDILADELADTAAMVADAGGSALIARVDVSDSDEVSRFARRVRADLVFGVFDKLS